MNSSVALPYGFQTAFLTATIAMSLFASEGCSALEPAPNDSGVEVGSDEVFDVSSDTISAIAKVPDHPTGTEEEIRSFEQMLESVRSDNGLPALAAALVRDGEILAAAAVGVLRADRSERVGLKDRFNIGSVSKPVSATVIATLVEAGQLEWETKITETFPELSGKISPAYEEVTLEQLLSHRAGIVPWEEDEDIAMGPDVAGSPQKQRREAIPWLLNQPPVVEPGTQHAYSNAGYMIAAAMAEEATGVAWEELVQQRLARPLGLESLGFGWPARTDPAQPWGHRELSDGFAPHDPSDSYQMGPWLAPAGDVHMNIMDLARFALLHLEGLQGRRKLLSTETFQKLHAPFGDYALGWNVRETADHHLGGTGTFSAAIWVSVPRNVAIVVATNSDTDGIVSPVINQTLKLFGVPNP